MDGEPGHPGPLAGITVVALEQAVSAPMCTRTLADFGARVIKVENPSGGDFARYYDDVVHGQAAHFVWVNRGKESITLDLKSEAGVGLLHRLLARADVLVSNLAPGATARLGLAPADLSARYPDLIAVEIDGFGAGGPLSHKRAYDLLVQAESGVCAVTGTADAPAKPGPPVADVTTGLYAALSILAALQGKARGAPHSGTIAVSLFDTMAEMMGYHLTYARHAGIDQQPLGMSSPAVAPYGAYPTADGQTVVLGTTNDREWQRLAAEILGRPDLAAAERFRTNPGRVAHRAELDEDIAAWCARHNLAEIQKTADDAGIGNSRYNRPSEVIDHPQLVERDRWRTVDTPGGPIPSLLPPAILEGYEPPMNPVPALGAHTDAVLTELGCTAEELAELRTARVIGGDE
ncbi:crotonobetainyl-CoA:carnitine CoA-transferase CaiB-like acyl-CoA transferase [Nocardia transvalensis]|uniref:Crotonobetainyl-CoA:carnitine CoA-transferase CaiB-like acyl-CoA transferase n=1 Tax=Nocardia transvalensis TaxID=37333 RepID=A0A7W9PGA8_9NOCA|nr:CaiB/BaiF CoA-transferase family protein [Nocardia transvalensis]MBB5915530.1 crotonobetainyl-CoA:carnitine CoA-transferase CaiB-like acyl-CoA transferase [Nocardia transvalensis]